MRGISDFGISTELFLSNACRLQLARELQLAKEAQALYAELARSEAEKRRQAELQLAKLTSGGASAASCTLVVTVVLLISI